MTIFVLVSFFLLRNIRGTCSKYFHSSSIVNQLIVYLRLNDQLPYVPLHEFYIHSTYLKYLCIQISLLCFVRRPVLQINHQFLFLSHKLIILVTKILHLLFYKNSILTQYFFFLGKLFLQVSLCSIHYVELRKRKFQNL